MHIVFFEHDTKQRPSELNSTSYMVFVVVCVEAVNWTTRMESSVNGVVVGTEIKVGNAEWEPYAFGVIM